MPNFPTELDAFVVELGDAVKLQGAPRARALRGLVERASTVLADAADAAVVQALDGGDLTYAELAKQLGVSVHAVNKARSRYTRRTAAAQSAAIANSGRCTCTDDESCPAHHALDVEAEVTR